jgi:hypothetical protein
MWSPCSINHAPDCVCLGCIALFSTPPRRRCADIALPQEDEELVAAVVTGKISSNLLENKRGDCRCAARLRREAMWRIIGRQIEGLHVHPRGDRSLCLMFVASVMSILRSSDSCILECLAIWAAHQRSCRPHTTLVVGMTPFIASFWFASWQYLSVMVTILILPPVVFNRREHAPRQCLTWN